MSFIKKRRKGDIVLFQVELQEIEWVNHRRINIEEAMGTCYTDGINIVGQGKKIWKQTQNVCAAKKKYQRNDRVNAPDVAMNFREKDGMA